MGSTFVNLHTHSSYSPMWGVPTLEALCQAVRAQGQDALALTDTNGLYEAIRFLDVAREAGLKPILGAELIHGAHRAVLLAKTPTGYGTRYLVLRARLFSETTKRLSFGNASLDYINGLHTGSIIPRYVSSRRVRHVQS